MNKYSRYTYTIILLLTSLIVLSTNQQIINNNYIAVKDDKILTLNINNLVTTNIQFNFILISNNQASFTIQVPAITKQNNETKYPIQNYTNHFAQLYEKILNKGYLKPYRQNFVKGYKYFKNKQIQSTNKQLQTQFQQLLQNILQLNGLSQLNINTSDDIFNIQLILTQKQQLKINKIELDYPNCKKHSLPKQIKQLIKQGKIRQSQDQQNSQRQVQRTLTGNGLHQKVNITIRLQEKLNSLLDKQKQNCFFQFDDILPQSTYIDSDQRRKQTTDYQTINIQLPQFVSKQYFYKYSVPLKQCQKSGIQKYTYQQPIHFRYPKPSKLNFTKVKLHNIESARIVCKGQNNINNVYEFRQNLFHQRGVAKIPNGEENLARVVPIITLAVCLIAVIKIINTLKKD